MHKLSVASTFYNSEDTIIDFIKSILSTIKKLNISEYEIVLVNDGSKDSSIDKILDNYKNENIKIINLSKNFGHHQATMTAYKYCSGDFVFFIDSDLEVDPSVLEDLWNNLSDCDLIYGKTKKKYDGIVRKFQSNLFYNILNMFSEIKYNPENLNVILFKKKCIDSILKYEEKNIVTFSIYNLIGFRNKGIYIEKKTNKNSTYTLFKKIDLGLEFLISTTTKPIKILFYMSLINIIIFTVFSIKIFYTYLVSSVQPGYTSIALLQLYFYSFITFLISFLLLYVSKIYLETKRRPIAIIDKVIDLKIY